MTVVSFEHALLLQSFKESEVSVEDLARAYASIDGKKEQFDQEKDISITKAVFGDYHGYVSEIEEILRRAIKYAKERKDK